MQGHISLQQLLRGGSLCFLPLSPLDLGALLRGICFNSQHSDYLNCHAARIVTHLAEWAFRKWSTYEKENREIHPSSKTGHGTP